MTPAEASKARLRVLEREAAAVGKADNIVRKGHRPPGPAKTLSGGSEKKQAALQQEISRNRRHVQAVEEHPAFDQAGWKRSHVLAASESLAALPKRDQAATLAGVQEAILLRWTRELTEEEFSERAQSLLDELNGFSRSALILSPSDIVAFALLRRKFRTLMIQQLPPEDSYRKFFDEAYDAVRGAHDSIRATETDLGDLPFAHQSMSDAAAEQREDAARRHSEIFGRYVDGLRKLLE